MQVGFEDVFFVLVFLFDFKVWIVFMVVVDDWIVSSRSEMMVVWGNDLVMDFDLMDELNVG